MQALNLLQISCCRLKGVERVGWLAVERQTSHLLLLPVSLSAPLSCLSSDANWIESANSVMDDNRLLTLPSNERICLLPHMKVGRLGKALSAALCWPPGRAQLLRAVACDMALLPCTQSCS